MRSLSLFPVLLASVFALQGCTSLPEQADTESEKELDELEPMPAATEMTLDPALASGVIQPPPEETGDGAGDLWERMREGFALDLDRNNRRIENQRNWYARNQAYLDRVAERAQRYLHHIVEQAEKKEVPLELALLPVVESAFDPFAYSHGRASGPWQFIAGTGRRFGMESNYWMDGRRDILLSTEGALEYLERLAERFDGDWELALASYNVGSGNVSRAMRRNRRAGQDTDYWSLQLPRETMNYVPKLIGLAQIVKEPEEYDVTLKPIADEPYFEVVETQYQIDMTEAAALADTSVEELYMLNPHINRWATPPEGPHRLLVPVDKADRLRKELAGLSREERMRWEEYTVRSGDTLSTIARRHNTTTRMIRQSNDLDSNTIVTGQTLLLPTPSGESGDYSLSEDERLAASQNRGGAGQHKVRHNVQSGESLWDIARRYDTGVRELASINNMAPGDTLHAGRELVIWTDKAGAGNGNRVIEGQPNMIRRINYGVRSGDSLYRIADRFNVSVSELKSWNGIDPNSYLHPGDQLKLYVDIREVR